MGAKLTLGELQESLHSQVPGIDGFPVEFYKAFWAVIGQELESAGRAM